MIPPRGKQCRVAAWWQGVTDRWNHTPGSLKWLGGILLGVLVRMAQIMRLLRQGARDAAAAVNGKEIRM